MKSLGGSCVAAIVVWGLAAAASAQSVGVEVGVGSNQGGVYVGQPPPPQQQVYVQPQPQQVYVQPQPVYQPQPIYAPQPQRQQVEVERPHIALIVPGAVLWGVGWILNFIVGLPAGDDPFSSDPSENDWDAFRFCSLIPLAGPWIQFAVMPPEGSAEDNYWPLWLVFDGLLQALGATLLFIGIATPQRVLTYAESDSPESFQISFSPSVGPEHAGVGLSGRF